MAPRPAAQTLNGLTFSNAAQIVLPGRASLRATGTQTYSGAGAIVVAGGSLTVSGGALTLAPDVSIHTDPATIPVGTAAIAGTITLTSSSLSGPSSLVNQGIISADTPGLSLTIFGSNAAGTSLTTYAGLPVDDTTLLTQLTLPGDASLDGAVDAADYALLDRSYARALPDAHWTNGDFDYDGQITPADYLVIDTTLARQSGGPSPAPLAAREARFGPAYVSQIIASVPEPTTSLAAWIFGTTALQRRRHRRSRSAGGAHNQGRVQSGRELLTAELRPKTMG